MNEASLLIVLREGGGNNVLWSVDKGRDSRIKIFCSRYKEEQRGGNLFKGRDAFLVIATMDSIDKERTFYTAQQRAIMSKSRTYLDIYIYILRQKGYFLESGLCPLISEFTFSCGSRGGFQNRKDTSFMLGQFYKHSADGTPSSKTCLVAFWVLRKIVALLHLSVLISIATMTDCPVPHVRGCEGHVVTAQFGSSLHILQKRTKQLV